ncbi:PEP-CTERM sorting domain-containing protein [Paucibacter sp. DJ1R-11]|uniref:PEP-CTERM sorting domain-containing protein n=1 Tax=Paucibacter sp. DJ1R-11 TaxID=2893556 RepID=UPI0021E37332|nr:PEP-CTERM sorting domain-containing protein [Paucibacter sp. DJ1R-11]MCV2365151.1 PEP-CTERM sorting domain-containing protein [Paucibacter sp. DJ1R-11]
MMKKASKTLLPALALLAAGSSAQASIATDNQPELLLVLWDPVAKLSYTKDLGMDASSFWVLAQQDAGYQKLINLDPTDKALLEFKKGSTVVANQRWAVFAVDAGPSLKPGDTRLYTTVQQGPAEGVVNPHWQDLNAMAAGDLLFTAREMPNQFIGSLNFSKPSDRAFNTHGASEGFDRNVNGSSFDTASSGGYFAGRSGFSARANLLADGDSFGGAFSVSNAVGKSSWFYYVTNSANGSLAVDEFDNLSYNGYWGLAQNSSGNYVLSFTQQAANSPAANAVTGAGLQRVNQTDYAAGFESRWIDSPTGEFADFQANTVSAVPEPQSWVLLGLGLASLWAGRRQGGRAQKR